MNISSFCSPTQDVVSLKRPIGCHICLPLTLHNPCSGQQLGKWSGMLVKDLNSVYPIILEKQVVCVVRPSRKNFNFYVLFKVIILSPSYKITTPALTGLYYQAQEVQPVIYFKPRVRSMHCHRESSSLPFNIIRTSITTPTLQMGKVRKRIFNDIPTQTFTWSIDIAYNLVRMPSRQESHTKRHQNSHTGHKTLQTAIPLI